ncbi:unnamed protein product (macronuclear) [Paramecium tetraurelia]|uniref:J domain-containing protein n=1 Tax=Paramecium tetraurelia TaxID=5888 RepID=A0C165_PARTE|nr:uncharacterized protein GSPATT00034008001 [Paramecium tetraurelia]CAK64532.1 unnamed protein product [Paramecium tetraurelia]|eukprot:XP_001431930.1 hypothetical protein (macronuclear) [Paramecium tetraurelia strain d4-2]
MFRSYRLYYAFNRFSGLTKFTKDYYKILKIPDTATQADIRIAYLKLASRYHPESQTKDEAKYSEVREAFQVLSDTSLKIEFDKQQQNSNGQENYEFKSSQQEQETTQKQEIEIQFLFKKGDTTFPFKLDVSKQKQLSKEELEKISVYHMKKFMVIDGGFNKFFKDNISQLEKGLSWIIAILSIIAKKK